MSDDERTIEVRDVDVETAVEKGLARLGVSADEVEIEVLDRGSRGLLGLGSREAIVRLTRRGVEAAAPAVRATDLAPPPIPVPPPQPAAAPPPVQDEVLAAEAAPPVLDDGGAPAESTDDEAQETEEDELAIALDVVNGLLEKMGIEADTEVALSEKDDRSGRQTPIVSVRGDDLSLLIGPRGETLNSLQFVARIMTGHRLRRRSNLVVDVAGYRERRRQALTRLAERMAGKVVKRNQAVTLEPMPPYERRLIHLALRDHEHVYTESAGEGKRRRVRIYPKAG